jgi:3-hydroxybutyryl-CoA dehydratase
MSDVELRVGQIFTTPSKTLTDAHFLFFSGLTGDNHPIHYDVEYAKTTRFGTPLAHGLLLASLTALGASPASPHIDGFVFVEQGSRFLKPVAVGDTIHPRLMVGTRRFVRFATSITNQRGETVLEGFHLYRVIPRAGGAARSEESHGGQHA